MTDCQNEGESGEDVSSSDPHGLEELTCFRRHENKWKRKLQISKHNKEFGSWIVVDREKLFG